MSTIQTGSGHEINFLQPDLRSISLADIMVALERIPRFSGHTQTPWSVLDHSVLCYLLASQVETAPEILMSVLMHDAHEAYVGDMPTPLKQLCLSYQRYERIMQRAVLEKFKLTGAYDTHLETVKNIDTQALTLEAFLCLGVDVTTDPHWAFVRGLDIIALPPDAISNLLRPGYSRQLFRAVATQWLCDNGLVS
jgi:hypothetical protein